MLSASDGSWDRFKADWERQCEEVGDTFDEYAADSIPVLTGIIDGSSSSVGGGSVTRVGALWDEETQRYYACCMLNSARLPGTVGKTLRVRHVLVSPLLDYGVASVGMYPRPNRNSGGGCSPVLNEDEGKPYSVPPSEPRRSRLF